MIAQRVRRHGHDGPARGHTEGAAGVAGSRRASSRTTEASQARKMKNRERRGPREGARSSSGGLQTTDEATKAAVSTGGTVVGFFTHSRTLVVLPRKKRNTSHSRVGLKGGTSSSSQGQEENFLGRRRSRDLLVHASGRSVDWGRSKWIGAAGSRNAASGVLRGRWFEASGEAVRGMAFFFHVRR